MDKAYKGKVPDILYHYTSLDALLAILNGIDTNKEEIRFKATHAMYLNDMTEGQLLIKALGQLGVNQRKTDILKSCFGYPFVLSLSELDDNLPMWNSYARQGTGVAIGLKTEVMQQEFKEDFHRCDYVSEEAICKMLQPEIEAMKDKNDSMPLTKLLQKMFYYKHTAFSAEKEWRIVSFGKEDNCRMGTNGITPFSYVKVSTSALASITFGPKVDYDRNSFAVESLLKSKLSTCIKPEMRRSQIPLN